ncbi:MAG: thiamine pyrophosphate-binding protein [Nitrososphaerales archaeon]
MNGAEALVRSLVNEGVEVIFGLPGTQILSIYDALSHEPKIRVITSRNEQAITYMADGYARTTGKVGVALTVPGPGALNTLSGLGTAYSASSPVLLISGQVPSQMIGSGKGALHEVDDQLDVFRPLTKWCARITRSEDIPEAIHEAMERLKTGRPRPVELEFPPDILRAKSLPLVRKTAPATSKNPAPEPSMIAKAVKILSRSRRPVILAGGGVIASDASQALQELAEKLNAPVITSPEGKGSIPENHRLSLGANYHFGPVKYVVPKADVIFAVGTRLFPPTWRLKFEPGQRLIQVDIDSQEICRNIQVALGINSDARSTLEQILKQLRVRNDSSSDWRAEELDDIKGRVRKDLKKYAPVQLSILETLRAELAGDAILVNCITNLGFWSSVCYKVLKPRTFITASYFGTLGYGFPTALGAKIGNRDTQVVALCGDGGFLYCAQELITAVNEKANLVVLLFNDNAYGTSLSEQRIDYGGNIFATRLKNPDFIRLTEAFGARGVKLTGIRELKGALRKSLGLKKPTVIEIPMPTLVPPFQIIQSNRTP